jgi:hypothetical protein
MWKLLAALFVVMVFVFSPFFTTDFGFHNDYRVRDQVVYTQHAEYVHLLYVGRPVNAVLFNWHQSLFTHVADFKAGRVASFVATFIAAALFFLYLSRRVKVDSATAFTMALVAATLPPCVLDAGWLSNAVPGPFNLVMAAVAYGVLDAGWRLVQRRVRAGIIAVVAGWPLLVAAFLNYPPTTLVVLLPAFVRILAASRPPWEDVRRLVLRDLILTGAAMVAYFALHRFVLTPYFTRTLGTAFTSWDTKTYTFAVSFSWHEWTARLGQALRVAGNLWSTSSGWLLPATIAFVSAVALVATSSSAGRQTAAARWRFSVERIVLLVLIGGFMLSPVLLPPNGFVAYRVIVPFAAAAGCLAVWAVLTLAGVVPVRRGGSIVRTVAVLGFVLFAAVGGRRIALAMSQNAAAELAFYRSHLVPLQSVPAGSSARIDIRLLPQGTSLIGTRLPLELSGLASNEGLFMDAIVHCVAEEMGVPRDRYTIRTFRFSERPPPRGTGVIVVDLGDAIPISRTLRN